MQKRFNIFWPQIKNIEQAMGACKTGMFAAILGAIGTTAFIILGYLSWWSLLDVCIFIGIAIGIKKYSRIATILGLIYFIWAKLAWWINPGSNEKLLGLFFIWVYFNAIRGAFAYHKYRVQVDTANSQ